MKYSMHKEIFGIRKLKAGVCSVILAVSFLGVHQVRADEVTTSLSESENLVENTITIVDDSLLSSENSPQVFDMNTLPISEDTLERKENLAPIETRERLSTSEEKLNSVDEIPALSVKDFGAVGDGVTDDRQAIQDTIDAAATGLGAGKVYFPEGTYLVEEILFLRSHTYLELDENATILNGINQKNHPSIVFMTGLFTDDGDQVEWEPTEDIRFTGGTIDMNGSLNAEGTKAENLPLINSSGAFAIGNASNVIIQNVTFKDSYQGHAIQIAGSRNVLIDHSRFLGQALPKTMRDGQIISKESIQIEPMTRKGFPYALNDTGKKSENVTIQNSYFGKSDKSGELVTAIGTHYQTLATENPSNIKILNNHFDNMMYAGIRFTGFTDIVIKGNRFDKKSKEESVHYRENGAALVNAYSYKNVKDVLDLNKKVVVTENVFYLSDPKTKAIRVAKDSADYLGKVENIIVTNNSITNTAESSEVPNIQMTRISDGLNVSSNKISGGYQGISIENSMGTITVKDNQLSGLSGNYVQMTDAGDGGAISVLTHGTGNMDITTENGHYHVKANPLATHSYVATYADEMLSDGLGYQAEFSVPSSQSEKFERHLQFKPNTNILVTGDLTKEYDGQTVNQERLKVEVVGSTGTVHYRYYTDSNLQDEIHQPTKTGQYWLKLSVDEDENFAGAVTVLSFYIFVKEVPKTAPVAEELPEFRFVNERFKKVEFQQREKPVTEKATMVNKTDTASNRSASGKLPKTGTTSWESVAFSIIGVGILAGTVVQRKKYEN